MGDYKEKTYASVETNVPCRYLILDCDIITCKLDWILNSSSFLK